MEQPYDNIPPICKCGLCEDKPQFYRGNFREYASGHRRFKFKKEMLIKKNGIPKCPTCNKDITIWHRDIPNKYCSSSCKPSMWNQDKVRETVKEKYGVDNVFQLEEIKVKSKTTNLEKYGVEYASCSDEVRNKVKNTNLERYGSVSHFINKNIKEKIKETMLERYGYKKPWTNSNK